MGRPAKPTELKLLEGNKGKRATNKREPDPDYLDNLDPPEWMPEEAAVVWRELAWRLRKAKVLTVLDVPALEKACVAIATYRRATRAVAGAELVDRASDKQDKGDKTAKPGRAIGFVGAEGAEADQAKGKAEAKPEAPTAAAVLNPWLIVQSMSFKQATAMLREFGMTPAARSRLLIDPQLGLFGDAGGKETYLT
jgi:P27 family predicted phage terminase small subunit